MTSSFAPFFIIFFIFFLAILPACSADPDTFSGITFLGGKYLSDDFPGRMYPGQSGQYMVEFYNTGMTAWENDVEKIGVECFTDSSIISVEQNIQLLPKGSRVHSGKSYHFPFSITALNTGRADLVFAVVQLHPSGKTMAISDKVTITIPALRAPIKKQALFRSLPVHFTCLLSLMANLQALHHSPFLKSLQVFILSSSKERRMSWRRL
jgi:hypothetical protein